MEKVETAWVGEVVPRGSGTVCGQALAGGLTAQNKDERYKCPGYLLVCSTNPLRSF